MTCVYAGTGMMSFDCVMILTQGNWFQTNQLEMNQMIVLVIQLSSVCITNGEDMALQRQIRSTSVTVLWFCKTEIQDRAWILVLVSYVYKIYWQFWHSFFKYTFKSSFNFYPIVNWKQSVSPQLYFSDKIHRILMKLSPFCLVMFQFNVISTDPEKTLILHFDQYYTDGSFK